MDTMTTTSATAATEVRCPTCRKLVAVRSAAGGMEIRRSGHLVAVVVAGTVACACGWEVRIAPKVTDGGRDSFTWPRDK